MSTSTVSMVYEYSEQNLQARLQAVAIFNEARGRALFGQFKARLTGRRNLPSLSDRLAGKMIRGQHTRGLRAVEIEHIVGSESRGDDFDANFNPLRDTFKGRWVQIAELCLKNIGLPAIDLIQIGSEYFVRDGHHRVSVARALGWGFIDAWVTVLEV